jgi:tRNA pseudouridine13 synthase
VKSRINGKIKDPENFVVREIIDKKFLRKFSRTKYGVEKTEGPYTLFIMRKRNITTMHAIKIIAKKLNMSKKEIGYAGMKDKFSVSYQYITIKSDKIDKMKIENIGKNIADNIELEKIGYTDKKISIGDLVGNEFEITLHNCKNLKNIEKFIDEIMKRGMPNYFGLQRFGRNINNHIVGKYLIKGQFNKVLNIILKKSSTSSGSRKTLFSKINKNYKTDISDIRSIPKHLLKFFIHAYQSWIFNKTIERFIENNAEPYFSDINIFGYNTKLGNNKIDNIIKSLVKKEGIKQSDFMIQELKICCIGGKRKAFIKLMGINYKIEQDKKDKILKLQFILPKGSYATTLLELIK